MKNRFLDQRIIKLPPLDPEPEPEPEAPSFFFPIVDSIFDMILDKRSGGPEAWKTFRVTLLPFFLRMISLEATETEEVPGPPLSDLLVESSAGVGVGPTTRTTGRLAVDVEGGSAEISAWGLSLVVVGG